MWVKFLCFIRFRVLDSQSSAILIFFGYRIIFVLIRSSSNSKQILVFAFLFDESWCCKASERVANYFVVSAGYLRNLWIILNLISDLLHYATSMSKYSFKRISYIWPVVFYQWEWCRKSRLGWNSFVFTCYKLAIIRNVNIVTSHLKLDISDEINSGVVFITVIRVLIPCLIEWKFCDVCNSTKIASLFSVICASDINLV